jgi:hypothetical protein
MRNCFSHRLSRLVSTAGADRSVVACPVSTRGARARRGALGGAPGAPGGVLIARKRSILPQQNALHQSSETFSLDAAADSSTREKFKRPFSSLSIVVLSQN